MTTHHTPTAACWPPRSTPPPAAGTCSRWPGAKSRAARAQPLPSRRRLHRRTRGMGAARHHRPRPHPRRVVHRPVQHRDRDRPSGLLVIDLDTSSRGRDPAPWDQPGVTDGADVLALLAEQNGQPVPGDTLTAATPSGGPHLYYRAPAGRAAQHPRGQRLGWKIDTRAHGGYVLAAGSTIGPARYTYLHDQDPARLPGWLADRLTPPAPATAPPGTRRSACRATGAAATSTLRCAWRSSASTRAQRTAQRVPVRRRQSARAARRGRRPGRGRRDWRVAHRSRATHRGRRLQPAPSPRHHPIRPARRRPPPAAGGLMSHLSLNPSTAAGLCQRRYQTPRLVTLRVPLFARIGSGSPRCRVAPRRGPWTRAGSASWSNTAAGRSLLPIRAAAPPLPRRTPCCCAAPRLVANRRHPRRPMGRRRRPAGSSTSLSLADDGLIRAPTAPVLVASRPGGRTLVTPVVPARQPGTLRCVGPLRSRARRPDRPCVRAESAVLPRPAHPTPADPAPPPAATACAGHGRNGASTAHSWRTFWPASTSTPAGSACLACTSTPSGPTG